MKLKLVMRRCSLVALIIFVAVGASRADQWNTPYDGLFEKWRDKVTKTNENGVEIRILEIPDNVIIRQQRKDGKVSTVTIDNSGHGAVLCAWKVYVALKVAVDLCSDLQDAKISKRLDFAINRLNKFIVANSVLPVNMEQLENHIATRYERFRKRRKKQGPSLKCEPDGSNKASFYKPLIDQHSKITDDEFKTGLEEYLSVPRIPARNPCL